MNEAQLQEAKIEAQKDEVEEFLRKFGQEEKGIDNFFLEIIRADDTTKVGNLRVDGKIDELGIPQLPIRTLKELQHDCELIPSMSSFTTHFKQTAEDVLATSLSREGFLIKARITQKKEFLDKEKKKKKTSGLFGSKKEEETE